MPTCPTCGHSSPDQQRSGRDYGLAEAQRRFGAPDASAQPSSAQERALARLKRMGLLPAQDATDNRTGPRDAA
jgi:hypothetical protein